MDGWGGCMINAIETAAEMVAIGLNLPKETFSSKMKQGAHLLSPTGSDLRKYEVGTTFAGFHYDLNFITIHGKSRYPGLFIWKRDKTKMTCRIPDGCLLMQAGIMFEWITGGYILAGFHEVVYTQATKDALLRLTAESEARGETRIPWRVSSTLFGHLRYDVDISPLPELEGYYNKEEAQTLYPKCTAFEKLVEELKAINLCPKQSYCDSSNRVPEQMMTDEAQA
jgi:isopenicillin N synthase-like dioxygenase